MPHESKHPLRPAIDTPSPTPKGCTARRHVQGKRRLGAREKAVINSAMPSCGSSGKETRERGCRPSSATGETPTDISRVGWAKGFRDIFPMRRALGQAGFVALESAYANAHPDRNSGALTKGMTQTAPRVDAFGRLPRARLMHGNASACSPVAIPLRGKLAWDGYEPTGPEAALRQLLCVRAFLGTDTVPVGRGRDFGPSRLAVCVMTQGMPSRGGRLGVPSPRTAPNGQPSSSPLSIMLAQSRGSTLMMTRPGQTGGAFVSRVHPGVNTKPFNAHLSPTQTLASPEESSAAAAGLRRAPSPYASP